MTAADVSAARLRAMLAFLDNDQSAMADANARMRLWTNLQLTELRTHVRAVLDEREQLAEQVAALEAVVSPHLRVGTRVLPAKDRCTAEWASRRVTVRCDHPVGHSEAHYASLGGGRVSWHGPDGTAPEPCDGDCDCDCQPGQPCLCPERDCYCGPCPVCDRDEGDAITPRTKGAH